MANRLQRVLAMDEAMKARDEPKAGMHNVVNADGSVTQIPYMEDKRGRRTVMTREGPRVIRGHEGKNLPGDAIGEGLRNVLGGLFGKGGVPGGTPPFVPAGEDYFDMSELGPKSKTALSPFKMPDGSIVIQQTVTDAQGNPTIQFLDPNTGQQIGSSISPISETPNAPIQTPAQPPPGDAAPTVNPSKNKFGSVPKALTQQEQMINDFLPNNVSVDGRPGTTLATPEQRRQARERANRPARQLDLELLEYLTPDERDEYRNRNTTSERFKSLDTKARVNKRKGKVVEPSYEEKEKIKKDAKRRLDLQEGSASRKSSLEQARRLLGAFEGKEDDLEYFELKKVESGAGRTIASYIPGTYSPQGKFDEELDAFAEVAARQMLKAMGEVRPTNEDVEGAKKAVFGIGKDERTNERLLKKYIEEQGALEAEAMELNTKQSTSAKAPASDLTFIPEEKRADAAKALKDGTATLEQLREMYPQ